MRQFAVLVVVLVVVAVSAWLMRPAQLRPQPDIPSALAPGPVPSQLAGLQVDGVSLGLDRETVERQLGRPHPEPVAYYEAANCTALAGLDPAGKPIWSLAWGNHSGSFTPDFEPLLRGLSYGPRHLPAVGYDQAGRVAWICGATLNLKGKSLAPRDFHKSKPLGPGTPRPDSCMDGPFAFYYLDGHLEVTFGNTRQTGGSGVRQAFLLTREPIAVPAEQRPVIPLDGP